MSIFDQFDRDSYKDNTIKINFINPKTGNKLQSSDGSFNWIEVKSSESNEWQKQIEENDKYQKRSNEDQTVLESRTGICRALAAVVIRCNLEGVASFDNVDDLSPQEKDQSKSKLRDFFLKQYVHFTITAVNKVSTETLFMSEPEKHSSGTSLILDGAEATQ